MTKVVLDLDNLLKKGEINQAEYDKFITYSKSDTGSLAIRILKVISIIAIVGGFSILLSSQIAALHTFLLSTIGSLGIHLILISLCAGFGLRLNSGFLITCSALVFLSLLGSKTFYGYASYGLYIKQPLYVVLSFSILSFVSYIFSQKVKDRYVRVCIIFSRACLFIVNLGFWVGSLWGDRGLEINKDVFSWLWALGLTSIILWAIKANKRFVVNLAGVFGSIHFYTQWFHILGARPMSLIVGGVLSLLIIYTIAEYNKS